MKVSLVSVLRSRLTLAGLLCCLWVAGDAHNASAQAFVKLDCRVQSSQGMPGGPLTWQIKGSLDVKNLPATAKSVTVTIFFQKRPIGGNWNGIGNVQQTAAVPKGGGTVSFDSGFQSLGAPPGVGDEYRFQATGVYFVTGNPAPVQLAPADSNVVKPIP